MAATLDMSCCVGLRLSPAMGAERCVNISQATSSYITAEHKAMARNASTASD